MHVLGSEEDFSDLGEVRAQILQKHQVVDAPLSDDGGVVVVRCITEGVLVAFPLPEPVDSLGDEVEALNEFGDLASLENRPLMPFATSRTCGPGVPLSAWLANQPSMFRTCP